jgi:hypothetical protein
MEPSRSPDKDKVYRWISRENTHINPQQHWSLPWLLRRQRGFWFRYVHLAVRSTTLSYNVVKVFLAVVLWCLITILGVLLRGKDRYQLFRCRFHPLPASGKLWTATVSQVLSFGCPKRATELPLRVWADTLGVVLCGYSAVPKIVNNWWQK